MNDSCLCVEVEAYFQTKMRPEHNVTAVGPEKQAAVKQLRPQEETEVEEKKKSAAKPNKETGVLPAVITTLLLIPLLLVVSVGLFICWRRNSTCDSSARI